MTSRAFTLIELMIVIAVTGIMAAIAIPIYSNYMQRARASEMPTFLKGIATAQMIYKENPSSGGNYAAGFATIGFQTSHGTFSDSVLGCKNDPKENNKLEYACTAFYAFSTFNDTPTTVTCNAKGIGNFSMGQAIVADPLPQDFLAGCMDEQFHYSHGTGQ